MLHLRCNAPQVVHLFASSLHLLFYIEDVQHAPLVQVHRIALDVKKKR